MKNEIEVAMLITIVVGVGGGIWTRVNQNKGIGVRFLQYLGLTALLPIVVVLSLEERISQEMTGAILATAVGATLAGIGKDDSK